MFQPDYKHKDEWEWIIKEEFNKKTEQSKGVTPPFSKKEKLFNLNFIDQNDNCGVHRSGWQYVYQHLKPFHSENVNLYLDLYLDKTFHWEKDNYMNIRMIPYEQPWMGFIHHTFEEEFSEYNNYQLLRNPEFLASLPMCKGLFVLSEDLKFKMREELNRINYGMIPVFSLVHPTEMDNLPLFSFRQFVDNPNKKIIQIGGWLRDIFSFYSLNLPKQITFHEPSKSFNSCINLFGGTVKKHTDKIAKYSVKNDFSNNYYPTPHFMEHLGLFLSSEEYCGGGDVDVDESKPEDIHKLSCSSNITPNENEHATGGINFSKHIRNNWFRHFYKYVKKIHGSVTITDKLDNTAYDSLLQNNLVFVHLIEPSAVNTVIECISRNTPIIVNRHPAVVEMLGEHYPLYYTSDDYTEINNQVNELICNNGNIYAAYMHLKTMDKTKFQIETFLEGLQECIMLVQNDWR